MYTIGGGRILDASDQKLKRLKDEVTLKLAEKEQSLTGGSSAPELALKDAGRKSLTLQEFSVLAKVPLDAAEATLKGIEARLIRFDPNRFMHVAAFEGVLDHLAVLVEGFHIKNPLRAGMEAPALKNESKLEPAVFERALRALAERGTLVHESGKVRRATFAVKLSREDAECSAAVEKAVRDARFNTPRPDELAAALPKFTKDRVARMLGMLVDGGAIARLKDDVLFHRDAVREAAEIIAKAVAEKGPIDAAAFRDLVGTSRKYVIPLLEHLDDLGITQRVENKRILRKK
jgi:selenocysteine-specific elongation factor